MVRSALSKVAWVGRTASMVFGLALVMALVLGVASMAFGANGQNFILGKAKNAATKVTGLVGNVDGATLRVTNTNAGANDTALDLRVQAGEAPMRVNSSTRVANLNAATAGRADSAASADNATNAQNADELDGKDSSELPGTVVQLVAISGNTSAVPFGQLSFVTTPVTVTTTSSTQQLMGVVSAPLEIDTGNPLEFRYGLCYRAAGTTNPLALFYGGSNEAQGTATTTPTSWTAAQTTVPGVVGTWDVGFCARNASNQFQTLSGAGNANGWIEVVNPTP